jgi:ABC-type branched-subunit amino acid transport system substrate-binding protein
MREEGFMSEARALGQIGGAGKWLALFGAVILSACQVVPKGPPRPVGPVDRPMTQEPVGPLPTDLQRNRVALLVPLTGPNAAVGESISNAANMAVLDTGGKTIRVTMYDTATGAAAAAQKAIAEGNRLILGPLLAEDVRIVAPIARAARVPVVSFSNDVGVAGNGVYVMGFAPAQSIERVVAYARSKGATKFAGLVPSGLYGQRSSTAFLRSVEAAGGQVVSLQTFDRSAGSISAAVTRMATKSPYDAVLIADSARVATQAAPLIRAKGGASVRLLGTELWNAEGGLATSPALRGAVFASVSDGVYNQLAGKYRARFGKAPYRLSSLGYDAVLLVTRIGNDWKFGNVFPAARLTDPGGFTGIDGAFRFGRDGVAERALEIQQAGPGGFAVVDGAPRGF